MPLSRFHIILLCHHRYNGDFIYRSSLHASYILHRYPLDCNDGNIKKQKSAYLKGGVRSDNELTSAGIVCQIQAVFEDLSTHSPCKLARRNMLV